MAQLFDPTKFNYEQLNALVNIPGQSLADTNTPATIATTQAMTPTSTFQNYTANPTSLTNSQNPVVPPPPAPTDPSAILKGIMAAQAAPADPTADANNALIQAKINELSGQTDMTNTQNQLDQQYGVADKQKILAEKTAQLNQLNAESMARQENIRKQTLNQAGVRADIGQAQYNAQSNDEERTRAISALSLNAEIQLAQGNYQFATEQVNKLVELKYKSVTDQISAWKTAYDMNRDNMTAAEKKKGDAIKMAYDLYAQQLDEQANQEKEMKTSLLDAMQKYPDAGITLNDTLESANQKVTTKSTIYKNQVRLVGGGGDTKITPANKTKLLGAGFTSNEMSQIESDVNSYGIDKVLEGITDSKQKKAIQDVYGATDNVQFLTKDYFKSVFTDDQLKTAAKGAGFSSGGFLGIGVGEQGVNDYLDHLDKLVTQYRTAGYTDKEILKMMQ